MNESLLLTFLNLYTAAEIINLRITSELLDHIHTNQLLSDKHQDSFLPFWSPKSYISLFEVAFKLIHAHYPNKKSIYEAMILIVYHANKNTPELM